MTDSTGLRKVPLQAERKILRHIPSPGLPIQPTRRFSSSFLLFHQLLILGVVEESSSKDEDDQPHSIDESKIIA